MGEYESEFGRSGVDLEMNDLKSGQILRNKFYDI